MNKIKKFNEYMNKTRSAIRVVPSSDGYEYELFDKSSSVTPLFWGKSYEDLVDEVNYKIYDDDEDNKFYLEISGRQTGKTTRLVDAMIKHLEMGGTCVVYTINFQMFKHIKEAVLSKIGMYEFCKPSRIVYYNGSNDSVRGLTKVKNFFDEFEFIQHLENIYTFDTKGYYCTTLKKLREFRQLNSVCRQWDLVLELIEYSKGNYEHRFNDLMIEAREEYGESWEHFDVEYGKIFK